MIGHDVAVVGGRTVVAVAVVAWGSCLNNRLLRYTNRTRLPYRNNKISFYSLFFGSHHKQAAWAHDRAVIMADGGGSTLSRISSHKHESRIPTVPICDHLGVQVASDESWIDVGASDHLLGRGQIAWRLVS